MRLNSVDSQELLTVADALARADAELGEVGTAASGLLSAFQFREAAAAVAARLGSVRHLASTWSDALVARSALLEDMQAIALTHEADHGEARSESLVVSVARALSDAKETVDGEPPSFETHAALVRWLGALPAASAWTYRWLASSLAAMFGMAVGRPDDLELVAHMAEQHLDTADAAAMFFNRLDPAYLVAMDSAAGAAPLNGSDVSGAISPFAAVLARASHSGALRVTPAQLVDAPHAGQWFGADGYSFSFLVEALVAALETGGAWPSWAAGPVGDLAFQVPNDARVAVLRRLAALDEPVGDLVVSRLHGEGLLDEFVVPRYQYPDAGAAAGALLAQLGEQLDAASAPLAVEVLEIVATRAPGPGVASGAAQMLAPHLAVLADELRREVLPPTPLVRVLAGHADPHGLLDAFIVSLMRSRQAAAHLFAGFSFMMAAAVRTEFDANDPGSVAEAFGASGVVFDRLLGSYVEVTFHHAKREEAARRLLGGIISVALDLTIAAGPAVRAPAMGVEALSAVSSNLASSRVADMIHDAQEPEEVLLEAVGVEDHMVDRGLVLLAVLLHEAGQIALPEAWYQHGRLIVPSRSAWEAFAIELQASGFPYFEWFNHAASLGGYASTALPDDE